MTRAPVAKGAGEGVDPARLTTLNRVSSRPGGEFVLYWMEAFRRLDHNHALDRARELARDLRRPLVVYEELRLDSPRRSRRHHRFALEGIRACREAARRLRLAYWPLVEREGATAHGVLEGLARRAAAVVVDDHPGFDLPRRARALAARTEAPVVAVDSVTVVPLAELGPLPVGAAQVRRRLHRALLAGRARLASPEPVAEGPSGRRLEAPFEVWDGKDLDGLLTRLPLPPLPPVPDAPGGAPAGRERLLRFLRTGLAGYAERRSVPGPPAGSHASGLAPYLHLGHLSPEEVMTAAARELGGALDAAAAGRREGFFGHPDLDAFLDQVLTWRTLGHVWLRHHGGEVPGLERALPAWAWRTLSAHAGDPRPYLYGREELEAGETHDPLWNAAQRQLVACGTIHNYLRMLWGKKVVEWSESPQTAWRALRDLNDTYALDGSDPNSLSGILWCFGLFDRPWAPERPVFGTVRYMSSAAASRKFRLGPYLEHVASLPTVAEVRQGRAAG